MRLSLVPTLIISALGIGVLTLTYVFLTPSQAKIFGVGHIVSSGKSSSSSAMEISSNSRIPLDLYDLGVYKERDFVNERGIRPPFWSNSTSNRNSNNDGLPSWGPCYVPRHSVDWQKSVNAANPEQPTSLSAYEDGHSSQDIAGFCRPGFLIIGAGKCGTRYVYTEG